MSIRFMQYVWKRGPAHQSDRFVLLALADYANESGECWPSIAAIRAKVCMSERGVQAVIRRLVDGGWVDISSGGGRKNCNLYRLKTPQMDAETPHDVRGNGEETPQHLHPFDAETPQMDAETPQMDVINPAASAPKPSRTTIEPAKPRETSPGQDRSAKFRAVIIDALGIDGTGLTASGRPEVAGLTAAEITMSLAAWDRSNLDDHQIEAAIRATVARERAKLPGWKPRGVRYFDRAIADYAARAAQPSPSTPDEAKSLAARKRYASYL